MRKNWDETFLTIMLELAKARSTCLTQVACVITTEDHRVLAMGYNGSLPGESHCIDVGCQIINGHCERTIHAERNAINFAAREGISLEGGVAYLPFSPCHKCYKDLVMVGITKIVIPKESYYVDVLRIDTQKIEIVRVDFPRVKELRRRDND